MKLGKIKFELIFGIYTVLTALLFLGIYAIKNEINSIGMIIFILFLIVLSIIFWNFISTQKILSELVKTNKNSDYIFQQIESFHQIQKYINPKFPLPQTRNWIASPDLMSAIFKYIILKNPQYIVELGSGVSTLYTSYLLKQNESSAKIFSIDHSLEYAEKSRQMLKEHEIEKYAEVLSCPLSKQQINGHEIDWYTIKNFPDIKIDLLIVDGPPTDHKYSRYNALPFFYDKLNSNAIIIVDDYFRKNETNMVELWLEKYKDLIVLDKLYTEKGTMILMKK